MKESYSKGLTNHIGPESSEVDSNGFLEGLTGVRAGRVWSREIPVHGADVSGGCSLKSFWHQVILDWHWTLN